MCLTVGGAREQSRAGRTRLPGEHVVGLGVLAVALQLPPGGHARDVFVILEFTESVHGNLQGRPHLTTRKSRAHSWVIPSIHTRLVFLLRCEV